MKHQAPVRAAIYLRISADSEQLGKGVARQLDDNRRLLTLKGWVETGVYRDNDVRASRKDGVLAVRPEYNRMVDDIENGTIDAVVGWEIDRLWRDPMEQEEFVLMCEQVKMYRIATPCDDIDVETGEGLLILRIKAAVAADEVRKLKKRIKAKHVQLATEGAYAGGERPFGHVKIDGTWTVHPDEAKEIIRAAERILTGDGLRTIQADWNARGILTTRGNRWRHQSVRQLLLQPRLIGKRTLHKKIMADSQLPAIIDEATHLKLVNRLEMKPRSTRLPRANWLLGLTCCLRCDVRMDTFGGSGGRSYGCELCFTSIKCDRLHSLLEPLIREWATDDSIAKGLAALQQDMIPQGTQDELDAARRKLVELEDDYYQHDRITRATFERQHTQLTTTITRHESVIMRLSNVPAIPLGDRFDAEWAGASIERKSVIAGFFMRRVTVAPGHKGRWEPGRVSVEPRRGEWLLPSK